MAGELILAHEGTLEHFAGDGLMVFFNDPVPVPDHELQAAKVACAMRDRVGELTSWDDIKLLTDALRKAGSK